MNSKKPQTSESEAAVEGADDDVVTDPARSSGQGNDWSDEGGATPGGPADTGDATQ